MFDFNKKIEFIESTNDVLTVGELLIDMISTEYGDDFECDTYKRYFGGSPSNIAINVKRLGIRSIVASAVGNDSFGGYLVRQLEQAGVNTSYIQRVDEATSMVLVTKSKLKPIPIFYRAADSKLACSQQLLSAVEASKLVHFSCWPISCEPSRSTVLQAIEHAQQLGKLVCFDPNYHPAIWSNDEDGIGFIKSLLSRIDIVKPSEDDAERLFGPDTVEKQLQKFLKLGVKLVIMTLGKDGAIVSNGIETVRMNTLATKVVDATGAGDAFWSGFYAALISGYTIQEALSSGMATSAYKLKFTGAAVELPRLLQLRQQYGLE